MIPLALVAAALAVPAPVALPPLDPAAMADPKAANAEADRLEAAYPAAARPEAVRMLVAILRGSRMNGSDGWFGPAQSRYDWNWLAARCGVDPAKGAIRRSDFRGPADLFDALDRDGDGRVEPADLDWSDRSPYVIQTQLLTRLFRRLDAGGDGKLSRDEWAKLFDAAAGGKDAVTADDLRRAVLPRGGAGFAPGDGPSVPVLVRGLYGNEIGSIHEGPRVGDSAPDFTLKTADGTESVPLAKLVGPKPVVLLFGNVTCGPFRAAYPDVEAVYRRYKDRANFAMIYVREAHPTDGWKMAANDRSGVAVKQPTTFAERAAACGRFRDKLTPGMPVLVDEIDDRAGNAYSGMPARLYVIDAAGKVAYKGGRGPFGLKPGEMEQALACALLDAGPAGVSRTGR